jgi:hypothetical protein
VGRGLNGGRLRFSAPHRPPTLMGKAGTSPPPPSPSGSRGATGGARRRREMPSAALPWRLHGCVGFATPCFCFRPYLMESVLVLVFDFDRTGCDAICVPCIFVRVPIWLWSLLGFGSVRAFSSMFESRLALGFLMCAGIKILGLLLAWFPGLYLVGVVCWNKLGIFVC